MIIKDYLLSPELYLIGGTMDTEAKKQKQKKPKAKPVDPAKTAKPATKKPGKRK